MNIFSRQPENCWVEQSLSKSFGYETGHVQGIRPRNRTKIQPEITQILGHLKIDDIFDMRFIFKKLTWKNLEILSYLSCSMKVHFGILKVIRVKFYRITWHSHDTMLIRLFWWALIGWFLSSAVILTPWNGIWNFDEN